MLLDRYDVVLFDLDETLAGTITHVEAAVLATRQEFGDRLSGAYLDETERSDLNIFKAELHALRDPVLTERVAHFRRETYYRLVRASVQLKTGAEDMLTCMRDQKKLMGIVTNGSQHNVDAVSEGLQDFRRQFGMTFREFFQTIVAADNVMQLKPDPEGIHTALEHLEDIHDSAMHAQRSLGQAFWRLFGYGRATFARDRTLFIGNSIEDMRAAKAARVHRALVCQSPDEELRDEIDGRIFPTMRDLLGYLRMG